MALDDLTLIYSWPGMEKSFEISAFFKSQASGVIQRDLLLLGNFTENGSQGLAQLRDALQ